MNTKNCISLYLALEKHIVNPSSELIYTTPFELLVAVLLSAQATDISVNKATKQLFPIANTPQKILELGEEKLCEFIRSIGLYKTKAKHLIQTCTRLLEYHQGKVPKQREQLEALPGVGRKTANVILNVAFGEKTIAIDTHIFRVANRTGLAPGKTVLEVEKKLLGCTPEAFLLNAHHLLLLHGRYTCKARQPACYECVIASVCERRL